VNPDIRREKWGAEEDATLAALVQRHGNSWAVIARSMPGRTDQQCMGRWKRHLDPSIRRESWNPQEDALLFRLAEEYENAWSAVSRGLTGRTPQQCRTRWHYISGNPNAAEASRAAIQAMREAQVAAEAAKAGMKKRRGRPSKNALAAAAAGMLTVLAPLPKGTLLYQARCDLLANAGTTAITSTTGTAPPATVGVKRGPSGRRPGRPPRKKVPAVEEYYNDEYLEPAAATTAGPGNNSRYNSSNQYDAGNYQNNNDATNNDNLRHSIDGEEAQLLNGFWNAMTGGAGAGAAANAGAGVGQADLAERRISGATGAVVTGRRNRPTRARIPSRRRTSYSMSSEDEGSEDEEENEEDDDEDYVVKGRRYQPQQQQEQQRQQIWRSQGHQDDDHLEHIAAVVPPTAAAVDGDADMEADSDFEGEDDTDNEAAFDNNEDEDDEYVPAGRRPSLHARSGADADGKHNNGRAQQHQQEEEEEYVFGGIRTHPVNQQHNIPMSPSNIDPHSKEIRHHQQQQRVNTAAAVAIGTAPCDAAGQQQQQQQYFEEPALLLGSSRAERRVSLGEVPLSPAVFSPALTPPWSRRKRHNHARLAAFGPSVPTTGGNAAANNTNTNAPSHQGTPRRQHHHHAGTAAAAALQAGAPLASPGILDLLHSPESFHHQRRRSSGANGDDHHHHHHDDGTGAGNHHHHHHHQDGNNDEDFFPGVFPDSPALPQFAGLITPEWARAAAAASAAAEDAEVRRLSIASVARRLDVDSVAVAVAVNGVGGVTTTQGTGESPPQVNSLTISLSLSAGGIPPAAAGAGGAAAGVVVPSRQGAAAITPAGAAAIVAAPGIEQHTFFSPVETGRAPSSALPQAPYSTTTAVPSSASHGRTFLAAALQRTVGSGLMPTSSTFFPTCNTIGTAEGHIGGRGAVGELATPMAIEDLLLTPMGLHIAGSNVPQVALTALPATSARSVPVMMETIQTTAMEGGDGGGSAPPPDVVAALHQAGLVSLPAGQYNRVVLQNTTLTARKDAPTTTAGAAAGAAAAAAAPAPLSSSDVRMKLQALLEQV
jgi:Myb-like DNA-binding domain